MRLQQRFGAGVLFILTGSIPLFAADKPTTEIARVVIMKFEDKTGTKKIGYMPDSLQEAITSSMHSKYEFVDVGAAKGEPVATGYSGLFNGTLPAQIKYDEFKATMAGTNSNGAYVGSNDCTSWTSTGTNGMRGDIGANTASWSNSGNTGCATALPVYCIAVP